MTKNAPIPLPAPLPAHLMQKGKQYVARLMHKRQGRPLWNCSFATAGLGADVFIELQPNLVLRVFNRVTGETLAQTEPVEFGPHDPCNQPLGDRLRAWHDARQATASGMQPSTGGSAE